MLYHREILDEIVNFLDTSEIIVLHGARQVGKTSIIKLLIEKCGENNSCYLDLEDSRFLEICNEGPEITIEYLNQQGYFQRCTSSKLFLFIDEIQYLENPSNFLKLMHDYYNDKIKVIVSGSSSFNIKKKFKDSLVGRTVNFEIFPLSFKEFLTFKGEKLSIEKEITSKPIVEILKKYFKEFVLYGAYPKVALIDSVYKKEKYLQQIVDTYIKMDIRDIANIKYIDRFNKLVKILAQQCSNLLNITELANTTKLARQTIEEYLFILENTYVIKLVTPYYSNLRSELFKTPKIYFYDSGLLSILRYRGLLKGMTGELFETSVFGESVKFFGKENVNYWRTKDKKEIDFILNIKNIIVPIEVKLNSAKFSKNAIEYFKKRYKIDNSFCVFLNGEKDRSDIVKFIYPWEITLI